MQDGMIPFTQQAMIVGPFANYSYCGVLTELDERKSIVHALGDKNVNNFYLCSD